MKNLVNLLWQNTIEWKRERLKVGQNPGTCVRIENAVEHEGDGDNNSWGL